LSTHCRLLASAEIINNSSRSCWLNRRSSANRHQMSGLSEYTHDHPQADPKNNKKKHGEKYDENAFRTQSCTD